jgi:LmbE family N-acetylglucosaminyl deacetylase
VVYTHNPADKHDTHVAVAGATLAALRALPPESQPERVLGCEIWRDLDWLPDRRKVALDVSQRQHLAAALNGVFDSQIAGGKRYDLAVLGRRRGHATFFESHGVDAAEMLTFAVDLTPLLQAPALTLADYMAGLIEELKTEVMGKLLPWK